MTSFREFQAELERLHQQSESQRRQDKGAALQTIRDLIAEWDLQPSELGFAEDPKPMTTPGVARYRDPITGNTWTGRGRVPKWIEGQDRSKFEIG